MHSFRYRRFTRSASLASILAVVLATLPFTARAQSIQKNLWVTDNNVDAMAVVNNTLYLGGDFNRVGPPVVGTAALDVNTGMPLPTFPSVGKPAAVDGRGIVYAIATDGSGGWYIGGDFTEVNGQSRSNLAWLDAGGHVLPWNPDPDGIVRALAFSNGRLYVGGEFGVIGGLPRSGLALFEGASSIPSIWNPGPNGSVTCFVENGGTIYAAGNFTIIGGQFRNRLVAIDANGVATAWNPNPDGTVDALAVGGGLVYVGGEFGAIGGAARSHLAAIDASGAATAWNPSPNGDVHVLALSGNTLYVAGSFQTISGVARDGLAALNVIDAAAASWNPGYGSGVEALLIHDGLVYVAGSFTFVGGELRRYIAALDPATGLPTTWNPSPDNFGYVHALAASGNVVYVGGAFASIGMQTRRSLAAMDLSTGQVTPWNPDADGSVSALLFDGTNFCVGGYFGMLGGQPRNHLGQVDLNGDVTSWNPDPNDVVTTLASYQGVLYVGGQFTSMAGFVRNRLAAFDLATGFPTPWDPNVSGVQPPAVSAIAVRPSPNGVVPGELIIGGSFTSIGGQPRNNLAAVDLAGGVLSWNPNPNAWVTALSVMNLPRLDFRVYAGGFFTSVGGYTRNCLAAIDGGGTPTPWNPNPLNICETCTTFPTSISTISVSGGIVYVGGGFTNIGGVDRNGFSGLDPNSGVPIAWDAGVSDGFGDRGVRTSVIGSNIYLGGSFMKVQGTRRNFVVGLSPTSVSVASEPIALTPGALLAQPNPSRGALTLRFASAKSQETEVAIYDLAGRRVRLLSRGMLRAGEQELTWDGRNDRGEGVPSGLYFAVARASSLDLRTKILRLE